MNQPENGVALRHQEDTMPVIIPTAAISSFRKPAEVLNEATEAAKALNGVLQGKRKPVVFNGEQYLEFEDWQTVGKFYGLCAKIVETKPVDFDGVRGFEARAEVIDAKTGAVISAADSMCLSDEKNWEKKPLFQLRSMAQTRACAKALRNVLAWVVVLAGYRPTPAEEMETLIDSTAKRPTPQRASVPVPKPAPAERPAPPKPDNPPVADVADEYYEEEPTMDDGSPRKVQLDMSVAKRMAARFKAPCKFCGKAIEKDTPMFYMPEGSLKGGYHESCVSE